MKPFQSLTLAWLLGLMTCFGCGSLDPLNLREHGADRRGGVVLALRLPDDSVITEVLYTITGPGNFMRTGRVDVTDSSRLTFRIAGIPVGNGYTIALNTQTQFGGSCMGSATFNVLTNTVTRVTVLVECAAVENDLADLIVDGAFQSCPIVTSVGAIPGQTLIGATIALSSTISHGDTPVRWTGAGAFSAPNSRDTTYTCVTVGVHTLTVSIDSADAACTGASNVEVMCLFSGGCGDGLREGSEQCDDGNLVNSDSCTRQCRFHQCGDGILGPTEECDDGNGTNDDACSNSCLANICGNGRVDPGEVCDGGPSCGPTCTISECGDGVVSPPEECDDANLIISDACLNSCTRARCGDGFVQAGIEVCDDANRIDDDSCRNDCLFGEPPPTDFVGQQPACRACRQQNCTTFEGLIDVVAGCFQSPDPLFVQQCIEATNCAFANDCAYGPNGAVPCFCGTVDASSCQTLGAANGPCQREWYAAARTTSLEELVGNFGNVSLPSGMAFYLLECDRTLCSECIP